jgi:hypothetical protein
LLGARAAEAVAVLRVLHALFGVARPSVFVEGLFEAYVIVDSANLWAFWVIFCLQTFFLAPLVHALNLICHHAGAFLSSSSAGLSKFYEARVVYLEGAVGVVLRLPADVIIAAVQWAAPAFALAVLLGRTVLGGPGALRFPVFVARAAISCCCADLRPRRSVVNLTRTGVRSQPTECLALSADYWAGTEDLGKAEGIAPVVCAGVLPGGVARARFVPGMAALRGIDRKVDLACGCVVESHAQLLVIMAMNRARRAPFFWFAIIASWGPFVRARGLPGRIARTGLAELDARGIFQRPVILVENHRAVGVVYQIVACFFWARAHIKPFLFVALSLAVGILAAQLMGWVADATLLRSTVRFPVDTPALFVVCNLLAEAEITLEFARVPAAEGVTLAVDALVLIIFA